MLPQVGRWRRPNLVPRVLPVHGNLLLPARDDQSEELVHMTSTCVVGSWKGCSLEVSPVLLVDEDEVEVVARAELLVDVAEGWGELEPAEEQPDRYRLACRTSEVRWGVSALLVAKQLVNGREDRRTSLGSLPRTGAPSMISNFVIVSDSLY